MYLLMGLFALFLFAGCGPREEAPPAEAPQMEQAAPQPDTTQQMEADTTMQADTTQAMEGDASM